MRLTYSIIIAISLVSTIFFILTTMKKEKSLAAVRIRGMLIFAVVAEFSNLLIALPVTLPIKLTLLAFSLYFTSIDWILFFLMGFCLSYSNMHQRFINIIFRILIIISLADSLSLLSNPLNEKAFSYHTSAFYDETFTFIDMHAPYSFHLWYSYILVAIIIGMLVYSIKNSVSYYKYRFLAPLIIVVSIVVINAVYMLFIFPLDWSVILYSISGILVHYFAFRYMPRTLITRSLRETADSLSEGLIIFDINDNCLYTNASANNMFNLSTEAFNVSSNPIQEWTDGKALSTIVPFETQFSTVNKGNKILYKLTLNHITDKKGKYLGCYFVTNDITEEYRIMKALESARKLADHAKDDADKANRAKGNFLANMSHEIRTPINAILGMNEMILRDDISPEVRECAKNIQTSGDALLSLINDILDFSKIESGKLELQPVNYEPYSILRSCQTMIFPRIKEKEISLLVKANPICPQTLLGDEVRIRQILTNLCTNAAKYTKEGNITIELDWIPENSTSGILKLSVSDTGIGISKENMDKLFNAFERIDEKKNRNIEGTGLGLSITRELIQLMNGTIEVKSEYGKGSTFTVRIPQSVISGVYAGDYKESIADSQSTYKELFKAPDAKVLAVDDYKMNLVVLKGLLKKTEIQLTFASSGTEALEKLSNEKFDLILMDHMMPGMDGIETFHRFKAMNTPNEGVPVIMLTANALSGADRQYLDEGFSGYLSKPINSTALEKILLDFLPEEKIK